MTIDEIDRILADFRTWLEALPDADTPRPPAPPAVDLGMLAAQFTALRHDVNLQTKATRAVLDQSGEALRQLAVRPASADAQLHPTRKLLVDLADALSLSLTQVTKAVEALAELDSFDARKDWPPMPAAPSPVNKSFWGRLRGDWNAGRAWFAWSVLVQERADAFVAERTAACEQLAPVLAGLADGYTMGLSRVERAFPQYGLEPIECDGEAFDPELMEVVEVVGDADAPTGTVVGTIRAGYRADGRVFRFAQVAVAR